MQKKAGGWVPRAAGVAENASDRPSVRLDGCRSCSVGKFCGGNGLRDGSALVSRFGDGAQSGRTLSCLPVGVMVMGSQGSGESRALGLRRLGWGKVGRQ